MLECPGVVEGHPLDFFFCTDSILGDLSVISLPSALVINIKIAINISTWRPDKLLNPNLFTILGILVKQNNEAVA